MLEQLPTLVRAADLTHVLVDGHWPSYNRPFFPEVYKRSGTESMAQKFGASGTAWT